MTCFDDLVRPPSALRSALLSLKGPFLVGADVPRSSTEVNILRTTFDSLLSAMGGDREAVGDAIYGLKIHALVAIKALF